MYQNFLYNSTFHALLDTIDQEFTNKAKQEGCPYCGGQLNIADYPRSTFGVPAQFRSMYDERYSLCCDTCRRRITPPSVRFFGRRWFPAPLLLLISLLSKGASSRRCALVKQHFGIAVSLSTWKRWRRWWNTVFPTTLFWQQSKGLLVSTLQAVHSHYPRILLDLLQGKLTEKMCLLLQFLAPLTASNLRAV